VASAGLLTAVALGWRVRRPKSTLDQRKLSSWLYFNKLALKKKAILFHASQNNSNLKPEIVFQDIDIKCKK
jgi:hypothetical protein